MLFSNLITLLGGAAACLASPLLDIEKTVVTMDAQPKLLDDGHITVHLARIDDLVDDKDNNKLLLERSTHIALDLQLDAEHQALNVNGERVSLSHKDHKAPAAKMVVVKASTYSLPKDMPADFYRPEHVQSLVSALSAGIVSVQVRLESEEVPVDTLSTDLGDMAIDGLSIRKLGLFMRLTEVEGKHFRHSKDLYTPVVQLLIAAEDGHHGKIKKATTLSIAGKPVQPQAAHNLDTLPNVHDRLEHAAHSNKEQRPSGGLGFGGLWPSLFGQPRTTEKRPCKGKLAAAGRLAGARKGKALAHLNEDRLEGNPIRHHRHHHHQHSAAHKSFLRTCHKISLFFQGMVDGFFSFGPSVFLLFVGFGGLLFKAIRTAKKHRDAARAEVQLPTYDDEVEVKEDKFDVVVFDPPAYDVAEERMPLFDADIDSDLEEEAGDVKG